MFERFSEILQRFSEVLSETPLRGRFPSQRLSVLLPIFVLPLELAPTFAGTGMTGRPGIARSKWK